MKSLIYKTSKYNESSNQLVKVVIELNDEFKNGHVDFSMTGEIYEGKQPYEKRLRYGGCCHEEILKTFPEFKIFEQLHNCDSFGAPIYPVDNPIFYIKQREYDSAKKYLRCSDLELEKLIPITEKEDFAAMLVKIGVVARWEKEAKEGIKMLENLTSKTFDNTENISQLIVTSESMDLLKSRIENGYYDKEAVEKRRLEKISKELKAKNQRSIDEYKKSLRKAKNTLLVDLWVNANDYNNVIYYDHKNTICFNWNNYEPKITAQELADIEFKAKSFKLPKDVKFDIK